MTNNFSNWMQNIYGIYTLLLLNKFLTFIFSFIASSLPNSLFFNNTSTTLDKNEENMSLLSHIKVWASVGGGVIFSYLTGSHAYLLPLINIIFVIAANLGTFCCIGAPFVAHILKLSKFKFGLLKGWYILTVVGLSIRPILLFFLSLVSKGNRYSIELYFGTFELFLQVLIPFVIFILYQVEKEYRVNFITKIANGFSIENMQIIFMDIVEEIITNG